MDNLRATLMDYQREGESVWARFHAGKAGQLWYYSSCLQAYIDAGCDGPLIDEMRRLLAELTALSN